MFRSLLTLTKLLPSLSLLDNHIKAYSQSHTMKSVWGNFQSCRLKYQSIKFIRKQARIKALSFKLHESNPNPYSMFKFLLFSDLIFFIKSEKRFFLFALHFRNTSFLWKIYYSSSEWRVVKANMNLMHECVSEKHVYLSDENWNIFCRWVKTIVLNSFLSLQHQKRRIKAKENEFFCAEIGCNSTQINRNELNGCFIFYWQKKENKKHKKKRELPRQ